MQNPNTIISMFRANKRGKQNASFFLRFLFLLLVLFAVYSVLFHLIMQYEGQQHSWITGLYWTLTVMSTLGFGDITFTSDLGRVFSVLVLVSGIVFLLVLLPFTFIQHFYVPWLEQLKKEHVPHELPPDTKDHVILVGVDPLTLTLADDFARYGISSAILCKDSQTTMDLLEQGYTAVMGEHDNGETYKRLRLPNAAMLVAMDNDQRNTNIVFTAREVEPSVPLLARAENAASIDILELAGCSRVYQFHSLLGKALARRVLNPRRPSSILNRFNDLVIAEAPVMRTSLEGKTILESALRNATGVNIVGVWERGHFILPRADTRLSENTVIVTAGTSSQTAALDAFLRVGTSAEQDEPDTAPVLILGGGRVGRAAAEHFKLCGMNATIVDKHSLPGLSNVVVGDAADLDVLEKAGLRTASSIIITTHDDDTNIYLTIYCRRLRPDIQIISRATFDRNVGILHSAGADLVLSLSSMISNTLLNQLSPGRILMLNEGLNIFRVDIVPELVGKRILESGIRNKTNCSVVAVDGPDHAMVVNPGPNYRFGPNDELFLIGDSAAENAFNALFKS